MKAPFQTKSKKHLTTGTQKKFRSIHKKDHSFLSGSNR
jgi:hypothetical protein